MFHTTNYNINQSLLDRAIDSIPTIDFRLAINQPTGDFFYDKWELKSEFIGTPWEEIYNSLPFDKGEARLIKLDPGTCYRSHADIDDRWHLSIVAERSYLVNLESNQMYPTTADTQWHEINTNIKHSAVNFSNKPRTQLVVRKLLTHGNIDNPRHITITLKKVVDDRRFIFDDIVSPWLNNANKQGKLDNFKYQEFNVTFTTEESLVDSLSQTIRSHFNIDVA